MTLAPLQRTEPRRRAAWARGRGPLQENSAQEGLMAIEEGKKAPAFTLEDASGGKISLSDFEGQHVIVYFYPKDDTPGCTKEACGFRDHWKELQKAGVVVLGISANGAASHAKFAAK